MLDKVEYQRQPTRYEYRLTDKGRDFWNVLAAMWRWGSDWLWDGDEPPVSLKDRETGEVIRPLVVDEATGQPLELATSAWAATRIIERAGGSLRGSRVWSAIGNWRSPT